MFWLNTRPDKRTVVYHSTCCWNGSIFPRTYGQLNPERECDDTFITIKYMTTLFTCRILLLCRNLFYHVQSLPLDLIGTYFPEELSDEYLRLKYFCIYLAILINWEEINGKTMSEVETIVRQNANNNAKEVFIYAWRNIIKITSKFSVDYFIIWLCFLRND